MVVSHYLPHILFSGAVMFLIANAIFVKQLIVSNVCSLIAYTLMIILQAKKGWVWAVVWLVILVVVHVVLFVVALLDR